MAKEWYDDDDPMMQDEENCTEWSCLCSYLRACRTYVSMAEITYDVTIDHTATGMVRDAAVPTAGLNTWQERRKHEEAKELFFAWSLLCGLKHLKRKFGENLDWQDANTAAANASHELLKHLRKLQLNGIELNMPPGGIRAQLYDYLWKKYSTQYTEKCIRTADGKLTLKNIPIQLFETNEDGEEKNGMIPLDILICDIATQGLMQKDMAEFLHNMIDYARETEKLDKDDVTILQMYFGFGRYKYPRRNGEIARKLNLSDGTVTTRRQEALRTLRRLVGDNKKLQQKFEELFR